jgi:hypothetical protein
LLFSLLNLSGKELEVEARSRKCPFNMILPADGSIESTQNLIVRDVIDELGHLCLISIVDREVLGEVGKVLRVGVGVLDRVSKLKELMHKLGRYELPLNIQAKSHFIDPSI